MVSSDRKRVRRDLERAIERAMQQLQLRAFQTLTSATPVDTGFARAGWSPSVGSPDTSGPDNRPTSESIARAQATSLLSRHSQEAREIARSYKLRQGAVFISNPVRYVVFLNEGTSAQAPANFVERAIITAVRATERTLRL